MANIGHKLALLQHESKSNSFFKKTISKKNENNQISSIQNIPNQNCSINDSFLNNNFEFFQSYIYGATEDKNCQKIFTHLNSCYSCFSVFSQTMRDFFHQVNAKGVAK